MKITRKFVFATVLALAISQVGAAVPDAYVMHALDLLPSTAPGTGFATSMNSTGDSCGTSTFSGGSMHAVLWKKSGGVLDLGTPIDVSMPGAAAPGSVEAGPTWSICTAVSTYVPVGYGGTGGAVRALVFYGETYPGLAIPEVLPIPEPPPTFLPNSYAYAVNDSGEIAGAYTPSPSESHAMVWHHVAGHEWADYDLNSMGCPDWLLTSANVITKSGIVAGTGLYKGVSEAFVLLPYAAGTAPCKSLVALGGLMPGGYAFPLGANDKGQIVGYATVVETSPASGMKELFHHAFLWEKGKMTDLGVPPALFPVPPTGVAVGKLLPGFCPTTYTNSVAASINDNGKIAGWANMYPVASISYSETYCGWGSAMMYDTNKGAKPPTTSWKTGWNNLNNPSITGGPSELAPMGPKGLGAVGPLGAPNAPWPLMPLLAAFTINDSDEIGGIYATAKNPSGMPFLLTTPLPLKK